MYIWDFSRSVGGGQGHDPEHARAHPLGDPLDRAALAGGVPALEHEADPGPGRFDPLLHRHELGVQEPHLALVLLALHLRGGPAPAFVRAAPGGV
jgi:hypothetical protein